MPAHPLNQAKRRVELLPGSSVGLQATKAVDDGTCCGEALTHSCRSRTSQLPLYSLYWLGCAVLLAWSVYTYAGDPRKAAALRLIGPGLLVSRPSAALIMWSMAILLLSMSKDALRWAFGTSLVSFVPLDRHKKFHKQLGWIIACLSLVHAGGHYANFMAVARGSAADIRAAIGVDFGTDAAVPPASTLLFLTLPGATGHVLLLLMLAVYPFALQVVRRKCFEWFMVSHYVLFVGMVGLLSVHGCAGWLAQPTAGYWLALPTLLLLWQLSRRVCPCRQYSARLQAVGVRPGKIVRLEMSRPRPPCFSLQHACSGCSLRCGPCLPDELRPLAAGGTAAGLWRSVHRGTLRLGCQEFQLQAPQPKAATCCARLPTSAASGNSLIPLNRQLANLTPLQSLAVLEHFRSLCPSQSSSDRSVAAGGKGTAASVVVESYGAARAVRSMRAKRHPEAFAYLPGQYLHLSMPGLACGQWHPFTITSAPHARRLVLNIKPSGDFTQALYEAARDTIAGDFTEAQVLAALLRQASTSMPEASGTNGRLTLADVDLMSGSKPPAASDPLPSSRPTASTTGTRGVNPLAQGKGPLPSARMAHFSMRRAHSAALQPTMPLPPSVLLDGPFPAPAQLAVSHYEYVIVCGGGIGGTPLGSFLSHLTHLSAAVREAGQLACGCAPGGGCGGSSSPAPDAGRALVQSAWQTLLPPLLVSPLRHATVVWTAKSQPQMEALWDELLAATQERMRPAGPETHQPGLPQQGTALGKVLTVKLYATAHKVKPSVRQSMGLPMDVLSKLAPKRARRLSTMRPAGRGSPPQRLSPLGAVAEKTKKVSARKGAGVHGDSVVGQAVSEVDASSGEYHPRRGATISFSPFAKGEPKHRPLHRRGSGPGHPHERARDDQQLRGAMVRRPRMASSDSRAGFLAHRAQAVEAELQGAGASSDGALAAVRRFLLSAGGDDSAGEDDTEQWEGGDEGASCSSDSDGEGDDVAQDPADAFASLSTMGDVELSPAPSKVEPVKSHVVVNPLVGDDGAGALGDSAERKARVQKAAFTRDEAPVPPATSSFGYPSEVHAALQGCVAPGRPAFSALFEEVLQAAWEGTQKQRAAVSTLQSHRALPAAAEACASAVQHSTARVGVFFCGPRRMGDALKELCSQFSREYTKPDSGLAPVNVRFDFHKESFW